MLETFADVPFFEIRSSCPEIGILLNLGYERDVNYLEIKLKDSEKTFSYVIKGSCDKVNWTKILDAKDCQCLMKNLNFPKQRIKYVNIVETEGRQLIIENFKICFRTKLVCPTYNVATVEMGASSADPELLDGNTTNYGDGYGYSAHQIGSDKFLLVTLRQPFLIDSLRLLLWDHNSRYYHYYIDCSLDNENWTGIVDRTKEQSRSWQNFAFNPTPMMYIKIVGTYNSDNSWFHCVHFECPSQDKANAVRL